MAKNSFLELVQDTMLTDQDVSKMEKLAAKDVNIAKLLAMYKAFKDVVLGSPISTMVKHIAFIENSVNEANAYLNDGTLMDVKTSERDEEGEAIVVAMPKSIGVLVDKTNGIPERLKDMVKELRGSTEDLLALINAQRVLLGGKSVEDAEVTAFSKGQSWTDIRATASKK